MSAKRHVLFVHGVGAHSRLSSLLNPWQSLRTETRNPEAAADEYKVNLIQHWKLAAFDEGASPPYLEMHWDGATPRAVSDVLFYEVNYSSLAGVVRSNHPLDLTELFVGFDLAVNVARVRLEAAARRGDDPRLAYHASLARTVQRLAGVFVAATVPILGLPSILFRQYTQGAVAVFTRFFEDIATFALDMNGQQLISAHVERTVAEIFEGDKFCKDAGGPVDELVIVAHSLGTVVAHSYLVEQIAKAEPRILPSCVLTYGSPIGMVCWLWLFLDFEEMDFNRLRRFDPDKPETQNASYFTWSPLTAHSPRPQKPLRWINVVNQVDPIATAFPLGYVNLDLGEKSSELLEGGRVEHRYLDTRDSPASAHTAYLHDRNEFLKLLADTAGMEPRDAASATPAKPANEHWLGTVQRLGRLRCACWAIGLAAIAGYLALIALAVHDWRVLWFLVPFGFPALTVATLAFCQRLLCSRPTKRTAGAAIASLPIADIASFPHVARQRCWPPKDERAKTSGPGPGLLGKAWGWFWSFVPTLIAMLLPVGVMCGMHGWQAITAPLAEHWKWGLPAMLALFLVYVVVFAVSEFAAQWRIAVMKATGCVATDPFWREQAG